MRDSNYNTIFSYQGKKSHIPLTQTPTPSILNPAFINTSHLFFFDVYVLCFDLRVLNFDFNVSCSHFSILECGL